MGQHTVADGYIEHLCALLRAESGFVHTVLADIDAEAAS